MKLVICLLLVGKNLQKKCDGSVPQSSFYHYATFIHHVPVSVVYVAVFLSSLANDIFVSFFFFLFLPVSVSTLSSFFYWCHFSGI